jgi:SAM-dependent methyltransferase
VIPESVKLLSDAVAWSSRWRKIQTNGEPIKLNLGCSLIVCEGWTNIDASHHILLRSMPSTVLRLLYRHSQLGEVLSEEEYIRRLRQCRFIHHNLAYGIPVPDDCAEYIYTSHFLEHLDAEKSQALLVEIRRVLKVGGVVRICVPDLQHAIDLYLRGEKDAALKYFFSSPKAHSYDRHRNMFDFGLLKSAAENAGFHDIYRCSYRHGRVPDLDSLDNRPEETLYLEARK